MGASLAVAPLPPSNLFPVSGHHLISFFRLPPELWSVGQSKAADHAGASIVERAGWSEVTQYD